MCFTRGTDRHQLVPVSGHSGFRRLSQLRIADELRDPGRPSRKVGRSVLVVFEPAFTYHLRRSLSRSPTKLSARTNYRAVLLMLVSRFNSFLDTRSPGGGLLHTKGFTSLPRSPRLVRSWFQVRRNSIWGSRVRQMISGSHMSEVCRVSLPVPALNAYHFWEQFMRTLYGGSCSSRDLPGRWQFRRVLPR